MVNDVFLSFAQIREVTGGKNRTTIWRWEREGLFPKRRKIGPNSTGWLKSEVDAWVSEKSRFQDDAA